MTLESWSMGIARPVIAVFPAAWIYFISFILSSSFIVMNVIVGVVVNAIGELSENARKEQELKDIKNSTNLEIELNKLKSQIAVVENLLKSDKQELKR